MNVSEALQQLADNTAYVNELARRLECATMHPDSIASELREIVRQNQECIEILSDELECAIDL
jgi:hypothetical protein